MSGMLGYPIEAGSFASFDQALTVTAPRLWSPDTPAIYDAVSEVRVGGVVTDTYKTHFGIRSIEFTKDNGFLLNGKRVQIKGVCDHHDLGCLGSVALKAGFARQLAILKGNGVATRFAQATIRLRPTCSTFATEWAFW